MWRDSWINPTATGTVVLFYRIAVARGWRRKQWSPPCHFALYCDSVKHTRGTFLQANLQLHIFSSCTEGTWGFIKVAIHQCNLVKMFSYRVILMRNGFQRSLIKNVICSWLTPGVKFKQHQHKELRNFPLKYVYNVHKLRSSCIKNWKSSCMGNALCFCQIIFLQVID